MVEPIFLIQIRGGSMVPFQLHRRIPLVRRPFYQRDRALAELAAVAAERNGFKSELVAATAAQDALKAELVVVAAERDLLKAVIPENNLTWLRHRPAAHLIGRSAVSEAQPVADNSLASRIIAAYKAANVTPMGAPDSFWLQTIADVKRDFHELLMTGDIHAVAQGLQNPSDNMLLYGFDTVTKDQANSRDENWKEWTRQWVYDNLLRLAEAVGVRRLEYPEGTPNPECPEPERLLQDLDDAFGFKISFPNPFSDEVGLATSRGVASYRSVQALYQAFRIRELVKPGDRVVEIGAGLGRTAFYAYQFGIVDYTIIDIPMTNVAQGYFLGRVLGEDFVSLFGESGQGIRVLPPCSFVESGSRYDIAVNVDSLTEMARSTAADYCQKIKNQAGIFLSINHEHNSFSARDVCLEAGFTGGTRTPYWLRRGYVEEIYRF